MRKTLTITLIILAIIVTWLTIISVRMQRNQVPDYSTKIDSIESTLDSIKVRRDTIKERIRTTIIKIEENDKLYLKTVDTIIHNNVSEDYIFFTNYLKLLQERFDSIDNFSAIKRD